MKIRTGFAACEGLHWVEIDAGGTDFFNGRGKTPEAALADATGRMYEVMAQRTVVPTEAAPDGDDGAAQSRRLGGVGMPAIILLEEFCLLVNDAFKGAGFGVYHVGSSLTKKTGWRDVDVRLILSDEEYAEMGLGDPTMPHMNRRWVALVRAFSVLGREMTGLPIDFQIQQQTNANAKFKGPRDALEVWAQFRRQGEPRE